MVLKKYSKYLPFAFLILAFSACQSLHTPEPIDYESIEKTAAYHITLTFEALPTNTPTYTPEPTNTFTPIPTDTAVPTPTEDLSSLIVRNEEPTVPPEPTATPYFPDKADFVSALPSPNQFVPNQHFNLTWQLKNIGTSTWSGKYHFYYNDGIKLADQSSYEITEIVEPGGVLTITLPATAPGDLGTYKTTWVLENPDGIPFYYINYITIVGEKTFITDVPVPVVTATPASLDWMCSDPDRSRIQGDGCLSYCSAEVIEQMQIKGMHCYAYGEQVNNDTY
ncbi:MAG: hypothetical protein IJI14_18135 [Anaerolineaceae bacterium]|nr:hypothetical protein [Anaerolineaceae bacterium]